MQKTNFTPTFFLFLVVFVTVFIASCKKDSQSTFTNDTAVTATPVNMGLYEYVDSSIYRQLYADVAKIGTVAKEYDLLFDTGSGGMVLDADGILPASMITSNGFTFTGDSVVVNGITVYNQKSEIEYGDDESTTSKVYGNLAYAPVTVGDASGNVSIKRLAFFLYYKAVDNNGKQYDVHDFDTFGVSPEYDITFNNNVSIQSPLSYYDPGTGLTKGFKMGALGTSNFTTAGYYVPDVVTVGLTAADISASSGFIMHPLTFVSGDGYPPFIKSSIVYNNKTVSTEVVFDTGTEPYSFIEDRTAASGENLLPTGTQVSTASSLGFNYSYTITTTDNFTYLENPNSSGTSISIIGLEFFLNNSYLLNYSSHIIGLKNN